MRSCIEEGEDHETRDISGKEGIKGNAWIEEDECPEDEEEDEGLQSKGNTELKTNITTRDKEPTRLHLLLIQLPYSGMQTQLHACIINF